MIYQQIRLLSSTKRQLAAQRVLLLMLSIEKYKPVQEWKKLELLHWIRVPGGMLTLGIDTMCTISGYSLKTMMGIVSIQSMNICTI